MRHFQGINRIRLEFKDHPGIDVQSTHLCINRIRLEFKVMFQSNGDTCTGCINRIRLEFKAHICIYSSPFLLVLIESDWNLKEILPASSLILPVY